MKRQDHKQLQTSKIQQHMQLANGRILAFDEPGAVDGFPIVYTHGTPGSRLMHKPDRFTYDLHEIAGASMPPNSSA